MESLLGGVGVDIVGGEVLTADNLARESGQLGAFSGRVILVLSARYVNLSGNKFLIFFAI